MEDGDRSIPNRCTTDMEKPHSLANIEDSFACQTETDDKGDRYEKCLWYLFISVHSRLEVTFAPIQKILSS